MTTQPDYTRSSGNVFQDLGLSNPEEKLAKAKLASKIIEILEQKDLTQKAAASLLDIDQPKISNLYRGHLSSFSISRLIKFLNLLEQDVEIFIKNKSIPAEPRGHLSVVFNEYFHQAMVK